MPIRSHVCEVSIGETLDLQWGIVFNVNLATQTTLYSGRLFKLSSNLAVEAKQTDVNIPLYLARRGIELPDVAGPSIISSSTTGGLQLSTDGAYGRIEGIILFAGLVIVTSEYDTISSFSVGDMVTVSPTCGKFYKSAYSDLSDTTVLGQVIEIPGAVLTQWTTTRNTIKIRILRAAMAT